MSFVRRALAAALLAAPIGLVAPAQVASAEVGLSPEAAYPQFNGLVRTITRKGDIVYVGGDFTSVTDSVGAFKRKHVAAFNLETGRVLRWNPATNGPVHDLAVTREGVYVAGSFSAVRGTPRRNVALVRADARGGVFGRFAPRVSNDVNTVAVSKGRVYLGGSFLRVNGKPRAGLAAFKRTAKSPLVAWAPAVKGGNVADIIVSRQGLYAGGGFDSVGGRRGSESLALISTVTGKPVKTFDARITRPVIDIVRDGGQLLVGIGGAGGGRLQSMNRLTAKLDWRLVMDGDVQAISVLGDRIYFGGHFAAVCFDEAAPANGDCIGDSEPRMRAAAVTKAGELTTWAPSFNSPLGITAMAGVASREWLMFGGDFTTVGGNPLERFALFGPAL